MNQKSEQLTAAYNIEVGDDMPLSPRKLRDTVTGCLGANCTLETLYDKKVLVYKCKSGKKVLLCKNITYLGNPHPIFKKRIQIPSDWIELTRKLERDGYDVRFVGVYHYDGFVVFADFLKDTYLQRNCHNSAAHIYINDIYQGVTQGVFEKEDQQSRKFFVISRNCFADYLRESPTLSDMRKKHPNECRWLGYMLTDFNLSLNTIQTIKNFISQDKDLYAQMYSKHHSLMVLEFSRINCQEMLHAFNVCEGNWTTHISLSSKNIDNFIVTHKFKNITVRNYGQS